VVAPESNERDLPPPPQAAGSPPAVAAAGVGQPPVIDAQALFARGSEVRLIHRGMEYRLRITKQGKLILTK
jgi:hemin uptake protein HemP